MNNDSIDLHGMTAEEATGPIMMAIQNVDSGYYYSCEIITGNGIVLKDLALDLIRDSGLRYWHENNNQGAIWIKK